MKFIFFLFVSTIAELLCYPLAPIAALLADKDGRLPWLLRWMETPDNLGWDGPAEEPAVSKFSNKRFALMIWLWRNKAYRLRFMMKAKVTQDMPRKQTGPLDPPPSSGFTFWKGSVGPYWEARPMYAFKTFKIYMRIGWKMSPYFGKNWPSDGGSAGMFAGASIRTDDWDG